jgi:chemotaxis protein CheX
MTGAVRPACLRLPPVMDLRSAGPLARDLLALRGRPVSLDASGVERLGGLGLQVLISARLTWLADELDFTLTGASEAFRADCARLGGPVFDEFDEAAAA